MDEKKQTMVQMELENNSIEENQEEQNISFPKLAGRMMLRY